MIRVRFLSTSRADRGRADNDDHHAGRGDPRDLLPHVSGALGQRRCDVDVLGRREGTLERGRAAIPADLLQAGPDSADGCGLRLQTCQQVFFECFGKHVPAEIVAESVQASTEQGQVAAVPVRSP